MSVSAVGAGNTAPAISQPTVKIDRPHDGDSDDTAAKARIQATPAPGIGTAVNKTA
jgi:hypothetical protein